MALQDPNIMPLSRLDCPLSLETAHMGNPGLRHATRKLELDWDEESFALKAHGAQDITRYDFLRDVQPTFLISIVYGVS